MVRKKFTKREIFFGLFCTIIAVSFLTFYIWQQVESVRMGYKKGELEDEIQNLRKRMEQLEAERSSLLALDRIEKIAREKLNMKIASEEQIIYEDIELDRQR
jgi:cell division protein FtsL